MANNVHSLDYNNANRRFLHKLLKYRNSIKIEQEKQSLLSKLTLVTSILVTILFWLLVLPEKKRNDPTYEITIGEIHAHGINLLVSIIEIIYFFLLNFDKLKEKSFYLKFTLFDFKNCFISLQIYILSYFSFSFIYWLFDRKKNVIYDALNFNNPKNALLISSCIFFIIAPLFIFLSFLLEFIVKHFFMKLFLKNEKKN